MLWPEFQVDQSSSSTHKSENEVRMSALYHFSADYNGYDGCLAHRRFQCTHR